MNKEKQIRMKDKEKGKKNKQWMENKLREEKEILREREK